jgi:CBS domain-containing protein
LTKTQGRARPCRLANWAGARLLFAPQTPGKLRASNRCLTRINVNAAYLWRMKTDGASWRPPMRARDVMTPDVVVARPAMSVAEAAQLMAEHGITGLPVVGDDRTVIGMISDGDIAWRTDAAARRPPWWSDEVTARADAALDFVHYHHRKVGTAMTTAVISVDEDRPVARIAGILAEFGIKRVPVIVEGRLAGIVGRADLIRALATAATADLGADDNAIRSALLMRLRDDAGLSDPRFNLTVENGTVHLWGELPREAERHAVCVLAADTLGVRQGRRSHQGGRDAIFAAAEDRGTTLVSVAACMKDGPWHRY